MAVEHFTSTKVKLNYNNLPLPKIDVIKLFFSLGFRFYLNSIISLGLLRLIFNDAKIIKFSIFLYSVLGIILMVSFFFVLLKFGETNKMNLFYIRRFIIQPIFIMLFIPAFYYQKKMKQNLPWFFSNFWTFLIRKNAFLFLYLCSFFWNLLLLFNNYLI